MPHAALAPKTTPGGDALGGIDATALVRQMAHDLRQPLSTIEAIAYYLDMILPHADGKARYQLRKLQQMVNEANAVLNDAVHFCQAAPPQPELVDPGEMISTCAAELGLDDGGRVRFELGDGLPVAPLDVGQMQHLLRNLLVFFRQACADGGSAVVRVWGCASEFFIGITAEGASLTEDDLRSLLAPLSSHLKSGSGLAMASVRRIVDAHGGDIRVARNAGGDVSLTIAFPVA